MTGITVKVKSIDAGAESDSATLNLELSKGDHSVIVHIFTSAQDAARLIKAARYLHDAPDLNINPSYI